MKGRKNDFSMTFFIRSSEKGNDRQVLYLQYVHDTDKAILWCKKNNINWDYANIYNRRTREYIKRIYNPVSETFNTFF